MSAWSKCFALRFVFFLDNSSDSRTVCWTIINVTPALKLFLCSSFFCSVPKLQTPQLSHELQRTFFYKKNLCVKLSIKKKKKEVAISELTLGDAGPPSILWASDFFLLDIMAVNLNIQKTKILNFGLLLNHHNTLGHKTLQSFIQHYSDRMTKY